MTKCNALAIHFCSLYVYTMISMSLGKPMSMNTFQGNYSYIIFKTEYLNLLTKPL
jgi:hypothetical protein